jgi:hypothetical protein
MATSIFRNKNKVRPRKTGAQKRRRLLEQRRRLIALGVSEERLRHMTVRDIRTLLRNPTKVKPDA